MEATDSSPPATIRESKVPTRVLLFGKPEDVRGEAAVNLTKWIGGGSEAEVVANDEDWERIWPEVLRFPCDCRRTARNWPARGAASGAIARAILDINHRSGQATASLASFHSRR